MKVIDTKFPLTHSANRVALVTGLIAGLVSKAEAQDSIVHDTLARKWKKPVVAEGTRYESVTAAALSAVNARGVKLSPQDHFKAVQSEVKRISRLCTQDCWEGYYWSL
jgi:hypothetical protein